MKVMTADILLAAVTDLTRDASHPLATGDEIKAWCGKRNVDWGVQVGGGHFYRADHANAPAPLRKFKIYPVTQKGKNAWCLEKNWSRACAWAEAQTPRWLAIPWSRSQRNWMWEQARRVGPQTDLSTFDLP